jgi:hypothetical protein
MTDEESDEDFDIFDKEIKELKTKIELENKFYEKFNTGIVKSIKVKSIYIDKNNNIYDIQQDNLNLDNGYLYKNILVDKIKQKIKHHNINHTLLGLLTYNFDNHDIKNYNKNEIDDMNNDSFLTVHKNITTLHWKKTIHFFNELNELILVFIKKKKKRKTKKIFINNKLKHTKKRYNK